MRNFYTQIVLAIVLAAGMARDITVERRSSVEIDGVVHEEINSFDIPMNNVKGKWVEDTLSQDRLTNHAMLFPPEYEQGVCKNIIYDYEEIMTDIGKEVRKTARACIDGCVS